MAAALVSGVAATTLQAHPELTPDAVKHALTAAGRSAASDDAAVVGTGMVDAARTTVRPEAGRANAGLARSNGRGELSDSRGSLEMRTGGLVTTLLTGRQTAQLLLWDPLGYTTGSWSPTTWSTSVHATVGWNTARWKNATLAGSSWTGSNWTGSNWTGSNWTGSNWTGSNWTGSSWYGEDDGGSRYGRPGPGSGSYGAWD